MSKPIFVFGSNLAGIHGAGAAHYALMYCHATPGIGIGIQGECYAIPTKDYRIRTMPLSHIHIYILEFIKFAKEHPEMTFQVTRIGCGLAGYMDGDIAPMFKGAPTNCQFDTSWEHWLGSGYTYWGHI